MKTICPYCMKPVDIETEDFQFDEEEAKFYHWDVFNNRNCWNRHKREEKQQTHAECQ